MSDQGRASPRGMFASGISLFCMLGLVMAGPLHAASGDRVDEECRLQATGEGTPFVLDLVCLPKTRSDEPANTVAAPAEANSDASPNGPASNTTETEASPEGAAGMTTEPEVSPVGAAGNATEPEASPVGAAGNAAAPAASSVSELATDGAKVESTTSAPNQDTELFKIDVEPEPSEDELPSASDRDLFTLGAASQKTSDNFDARTYSFSYRNHRREWFWPWQESTSRELDWGVDLERSKGKVGATDFDAHHLQGTVGRYLTEGTYLQGQLGRHTLATDRGDRTITSRRLTAMFGLKSSFSLQLESSHDFIYAGGSVTGGITKQLTALDHSASFRWRPHEMFRIQGQGGYRKYDEPGEENIARQADVSALYGISPDWPWIWAGVGAQVLGYDHASPDYWSPNRYTAYGLRVESSFPLYKRLSGSAAVNLNRQNEDGSEGNGYGLKVGVQYRLYKQLYARLDVAKSKSLQQSSTWTSDDLFISLSGPLF